MPTIDQLPASIQVTAADELPLSQAGTTRNASVGAILAGTQPAISIATGSLLGRISLGPGGPEAVSVGAGLALAAGVVAATGADHAGFPQQPTLTLTDEMVLNSNGQPRQMPIGQLLGLFKAGANITIDSSGTIATTTLSGPAGPAGVEGPAGPAWSPPQRMATSTADTPTVADNHGLIGYTNALPVTVTVTDLGSLCVYKALQLGTGTVTLKPASGVALVSQGNPVPSVASGYQGAALSVLGTGTGTVYVTSAAP